MVVDACVRPPYSSSSARPALTAIHYRATPKLSYLLTPRCLCSLFPSPRSAPRSRTQSPVIRSPVGDIHVGLRSTVGFCNHCPPSACTSKCCFAWRSWSVLFPGLPTKGEPARAGDSLSSIARARKISWQTTEYKKLLCFVAAVIRL